MIRGIHHVAIHTPDIDHLRTFYEQAFGFTVVGEEMKLEDFPDVDRITGVRGGKARVVMMKCSNCFIELFEWSQPRARRAPPLEPSDHGYTHFCVSVTDIEAEYERLAELGMRFVNPEPVRSGPYGSVYGRDPDGNYIEIMQAPPDDAMHLEIAGEADGVR